jgi:uncharacterized protein (DUF433 family)
MLDWKQCKEVERHAEVMRGAWVFRGTRVPVETLFENLQDGAKVNEFTEWFPTVRLDQVHAVLAFAQKSLAAA